MAVSLEARIRVQDLIYSELRFLDDQDWDKWLSLFDEGVEFWVPAWDSEHEMTVDRKAKCR